MKITVQTVSDFRKFFGRGEVQMDSAAGTVSDLMRDLKRDYGFDFDAHPFTMVFVNGRGCVDFTRELRDGDHVAIVPIMAAG